MQAPGYIRGMLMHYFLILGGYLMLLAPVRALLRSLVFKPGDGPELEKSKKEVIELQAVAKPASNNERDKQIHGRLVYQGSMYFRK